MSTSNENTQTAAYRLEKGRPHPLGATVDANGVNFSIFSQYGTGVELLVFDEHDAPEPIMTYRLNPRVHKSFHFWHCYIHGMRPGAHYAYRVDGPWQPELGHRFNRDKVLVDPYAKGITSTLWDRGAACGSSDNVNTCMRAVVIDTRSYDWEGDQTLRRPMAETIIYEMHVGGLTASSTSGTPNAGAFLGVIDKIPYLQELGVTAVELLPVMQYDYSEISGLTPAGRRRANYWGYSTVGFFAPEQSFCMRATQGSHLDEFRDMVKALHRAGIEVILDIVFNHTSEGNHQGPVFGFKGFDNSIYYHLVKDDRQYFMDYSGCGNTVNCNHPIVDKFILECLEFWVREMHVDGFRFDEGSILSRGEDGAPMQHPPVVWNIELSEDLADTKIIAEAWDAAGLYQIGYFPGFRWAEWNGKFRDDVRRFVKGDGGLVAAIANRLSGSADLYQSSGHEPLNSINFITCHDGFTMNDLVSYNEKHNADNGEGNRDGIDENLSWNCGAEGPTDDEGIETLRDIQVKNFATVLLLSQGVPMLLGGDEIRRTQQGNNNAYCQDNELSWFDWTLLEKNAHIFRFFSRLIALRKAHPTIHRGRFFGGETMPNGLPDVSWHACALNCPGWDDPNCRVLAMTLGGLTADDPDFHVMMNMSFENLLFDLPKVPDRLWTRKVDTSLRSPDDILDDGAEVEISDNSYIVNGRSIVVLLSAPISAEAKARLEAAPPVETVTVMVETPEGAQLQETVKAPRAARKRTPRPGSS